MTSAGDPRVARTLVSSVRDGAAYAIGVGLGETYVPACAIFLGLSDSGVALLGTLPVFVGTCAQLAAPSIIDAARARRRLIVSGALFQALSWLPMLAALAAPAAWRGPLLFAGFILYFAFLHLTIPAWMSLMGDIVPAALRGRYFSSRSAAAIAIQLAAVAVGGVALVVFKRSGHEALGYVALFGGALLARLLSTGHLTRHWDPPYHPEPRESVRLVRRLRGLPGSNLARFVLFVGLLNGSAHLLGSVFNVYVLRNLGYSYLEFTAVAVATTLAQFAALPTWGRLADRFGTRRVVSATSIGITVLPLLWFVSTSPVWACTIQLVAGFSWSGFNLCTANFVLDAVPQARRARGAAWLNLITNTGVLLGGLGGAALIDVVPARVGPVTMPYAVWWIFLLSFALRFAAVSLLLPRVREVREVPPSNTVAMLFHASREVSEAAINFLFGWIRPEGRRAAR